MSEKSCFYCGSIQNMAVGEAYEVGKSVEQERIIKLLDDWKCGHPDCDGDKTEVCYPKHYLIALIKGEK